jgi:hypothetical protein
MRHVRGNATGFHPNQAAGWQLGAPGKNRSDAIGLAVTTRPELSTACT